MALGGELNFPFPVVAEYPLEARQLIIMEHDGSLLTPLFAVDRSAYAIDSFIHCYLSCKNLL